MAKGGLRHGPFDVDSGDSVSKHVGETEKDLARTSPGAIGQARAVGFVPQRLLDERETPEAVRLVGSGERHRRSGRRGRGAGSSGKVTLGRSKKGIPGAHIRTALTVDGYGCASA
jgi:hypothetical protein